MRHNNLQPLGVNLSSTNEERTKGYQLYRKWKNRVRVNLSQVEIQIQFPWRCLLLWELASNIFHSRFVQSFESPRLLSFDFFGLFVSLGHCCMHCSTVKPCGGKSFFKTRVVLNLRVFSHLISLVCLFVCLFRSLLRA